MGAIFPEPDCGGLDPPACCEDGTGIFMYGTKALPISWPQEVSALIYLLMLLWTFLGVAIAADIFMTSIVAITSATNALRRVIDGKPCLFRVHTWNPTVANLTLMALGSSAPEILLSLIELVFGDFFQGGLGPSTIVGSAAFNLFVIVAICVVSIPATDSRRIVALPVYVVTATGSILAYLWIVLILMGTTPDMVTIPEAVMTLTFFPILVCIAYVADRWPETFTGPSARLWKRVQVASGRTPPVNADASPPALASRPSQVDAARRTMADVAHRISSEARRIARRRRRVQSLPAVVAITHEDGTPLTQEEMNALLHKTREPPTPDSHRESSRLSAAYGPDVATAGELLRKAASTSVPYSYRSRGMYRMAALRQALPYSKQAEKRVADPLSLAAAELSTELKGADKIAEAAKPFARQKTTNLAGVKVCTPEPPRVSFELSEISVGEGCGDAIITLCRSGGDASRRFAVGYCTADRSAKAGEDYDFTQGVAEFAPEQMHAHVHVPIIDDDEVEDDESFTLELSDPTDGAELGEIPVLKITINDNDHHGIFVFESEIVTVSCADDEAVVTVERVNGQAGAVSCAYRALAGSAAAGRDYEAVEGRIEWEMNEVGSKQIRVPLLGADSGASTGRDTSGRDNFLFGSEERWFDLEIHDAQGGAEFDAQRDGASERSLARVIIAPLKQRGAAQHLLSFLQIDFSKMHVGTSSWRQQFVEAIDTAEVSGPLECVLFGFSLPWKLVLALIPPTAIGGGYPCFVISLVFIGVITALIGDLANLLGCVVGLHPSVVAITFVALGTSLPDTFASRAAALGDPTADNAVGNVTGSNAVNVFLGLGLSWLVGAIYWTVSGVDEEWLTRFPDVAARYDVKLGDSVGHAVPAGDLAFSVTIFCLCAATCISILAWRRATYGAELGAGGRWPTFACFVSLWFLYVLMSSLRTYGHVPGFR